MNADKKRTRFLTAAEKFDCRLMKELHYLVKAANQETDLRMRLERLQNVANILESISRVMPELDAAFHYEWLERQIDACQEAIVEQQDGDDWKSSA